jgi:GTP-binding protein LepA
LHVIPVINKVDLISADITRVKSQVESVLGFKDEEIILASAKEGSGVIDILDRIAETIPPPSGNPDGAIKALIFDCRFDPFKGVVVFVKVIDGQITPRSGLKMFHTGRYTRSRNWGVFKDLKYSSVDSLSCGEVGYFTANMRDPREVIIGDTITDRRIPVPKLCRDTGRSNLWFSAASIG